MTARQLSTALLCLGAIALGATQYLGSPWPGVSLATLSLFPWGWEAWLGRQKAVADGANGVLEQRLSEIGAMINNAIVEAHRAHSRLQDHEVQINSLRNTASLRGTLGG